MKHLQLMQAKTLVHARPTKVSASITANSNSWRFRVVMTTADFRYLHDAIGGAIAPKAEFFGDAPNGILLCLDKNTGYSLVSSSTNTVAAAQSSKSLDATQSKVPMSVIDAVLVEYDDGSRYIWIAPVPDQFLSTSVREARSRTGLRPPPALIHAFEKAGVKIPNKPNSPPPRVDAAAPGPLGAFPKTAPRTSETPAPAKPAFTGQGSAEPVAAKPPTVDDLKELLAMVNETVTGLKAQGTEINMKVEGGLLKATRPVVVEQEL